MIDSKTVKKFILNPTNDLEELLNYLDENYKATIEGIFNALFPLLKLYDQNMGRVDYLLKILEQLVEIKMSDELTFLIGPITDLDNKINKLTTKQRMALNTPYQRIKRIVDEIHKKSLEEVNDSKLKYLEHLIFQNEDVNLIGNFLEHNASILSKKNKDGNDIVEEVLKTYLYLDERDINKINYYYNVILIFLESNRREILKNKKKYYRLVKESKVGYKEHIIKVIQLLVPNFQVELSEIEERYNVDFDFHPAIMGEVDKLELSYDNREDYLYQECITIDGEGANCLDDALYIEKNEDGTYTLYIHITDIPSIVPYYSIINEEARRRGKTSYLRKSQTLMLPDQICNNMGSLLEGEKRNVISYIYELDESFRLISNSPTIKLGVIKNRHRLTYENVDNIFNDQPEHEITLKINWLASYAEELRRSNMKKEKYRQYENLINMVINHESLNIDYSVSANIVHESMILVNYSSAKLFKDLGYPYVYRRVIIPSSDYIEKQIETIKQMDPSILEDKLFINKIGESAMESMYWDKPVKHMGMNLECYSHSSSPARRYPDVFCQYLIHDLIIRENTYNIPIWEYRTKELVRYLNNREKEIEMFASEYNYLSYKELIKKK